MMFLNAVIALVALLNITHACPFAANSQLRSSFPKDSIHRKLAITSNGFNVPVCAKGPSVPSEAKIRAVHKAVKQEINKFILRSSEFAQAGIFGAALRLAFHDAGEIDINTSDLAGPDGCLAETADHMGLFEQGTPSVDFFEPIWQQHCDSISRADFWALIGKIAAERADPSHSLNIPFYYGRTDSTSCNVGAGRLPDPGPGLSELKRVFVQQMGLTLADAVTLLGAHSIGHVHTEFSGFGNEDDIQYRSMNYAENAWDESPNAFDNQYYKSLLLELWKNEVHVDGSKNTWNIATNANNITHYEPPENIDALAFNPVAGGGDALEGGNVNAGLAAQAMVGNVAGYAFGTLGMGRNEEFRRRRLAARNFLHPRTIMLNTDMALVYPLHIDATTSLGVDGEICGTILAPGHQVGCTSTSFGTISGMSETYQQVKQYAEDNTLFLKDFAQAYTKMVNVGYSTTNPPTNLRGQSKLGQLTSIDLGSYWEHRDYLISPFTDIEKLDEICPRYEGVTYYVKGFPGTPYKLTPFVNGYSNPVPAKPSFTECRKEDNHCIRAYEIDVYPVQARVFDRAIPSCQKFPGTWFLTYNGSVPGPTITMPTGHESLVRFHNKITPGGPLGFDFHPCDSNERQGRPFSVHFHGSASLAPYDGWADDETCFNETKDYVYPNNRPNTGWFHDHAAHVTGENAYDGMAGFYIISSKLKDGGCGEPWNLEDMEEKFMMIGDRVLDNQCQSRYQPKSVHERDMYGDINAVNGIPFPVMSIEPKWIRFRWLNAAISRPYLITLRHVSSVTGEMREISSEICYIIASDGGYRTTPIPFPSSGLLNGVAERYEVVCDFSNYANQTIIMWNGNDNDQMKAVPYFCYSHLIAKIQVTGAVFDPTKAPVFDPNQAPDPRILPINKALTSSDLEQAMSMVEKGKYHRRMDFGRRHGMWVINGETWKTFKIAANDVGQNTWEVWQFRTGGGWFHPIHMHLVDFFVLRRDGASGVRSWEQLVAKDVFYLGPANNVYVLVRFGAHKGDYMFHCHNLIHEDNDMLRAWHMVNGEEGKTAETSAPYVANPLIGIIYSNYKYADPMLGETAAKPSNQVAPLTAQFVRQTLDKDLYRIFYPTVSDEEMYKGFHNPWKAPVCPIPGVNTAIVTTVAPTSAPTLVPTVNPTVAVTNAPVASPTAAPSVPAVPVVTQEPWGQCGGQDYTGPTACSAGYTCVYSSMWYSQCKPGTTTPSQPVAQPTLAPTVATLQTAWGKCGGLGYAGPTLCPTGFACVYDSVWYSQCKPIPTQSPTAAPTTTTGGLVIKVPAWGQCGGNGYTGSTICVDNCDCKFVNTWWSSCQPKV